MEQGRLTEGAGVGLIVGVVQGGALVDKGKLNGCIPVLGGLEDRPRALRGLHGVLLAPRARNFDTVLSSLLTFPGKCVLSQSPSPPFPLN